MFSKMLKTIVDGHHSLCHHLFKHPSFHHYRNGCVEYGSHFKRPYFVVVRLKRLTDVVVEGDLRNGASLCLECAYGNVNSKSVFVEVLTTNP